MVVAVKSFNEAAITLEDLPLARPTIMTNGNVILVGDYDEFQRGRFVGNPEDLWEVSVAEHGTPTYLGVEEDPFIAVQCSHCKEWLPHEDWTWLVQPISERWCAHCCNTDAIACKHCSSISYGQDVCPGCQTLLATA